MVVLEISTTEKEKQQVYPILPVNRKREGASELTLLMEHQLWYQRQTKTIEKKKSEDKSLCFMNFGIKVISKILTKSSSMEREEY